MKAKILTRSAVAAAVVIALSAGYVAGHRNVPAPEVISPAAAAMMPAEAAAKTGIPDFSGLVETYGPAVVNISAKHVVKQTAMRGGNGNNSGQLPIDPSDPFYQFYKHFFGQMKKMGGMAGLLDKLPAQMQQAAGKTNMDQAEKQVRRMEGMINSMTLQERAKPELIKATRKRRIAAGAGVQVQEVNRMLAQFEQMQTMMKKLKGGGMMKMMRSMKGMMPGMR